MGTKVQVIADWNCEVKKSTFLRVTSSVIATSLVLASGGALAAPSTPTPTPAPVVTPPPPTVVNGNNGSGTVVVTGTTNVGDAETETIFTNYTTTGGAGSGGGAGLGGVFFVNQNATLNLNNVSFKSNVAKGGEGGSVAQVSLGNLVIALPKIEVTAAPIDLAGGAAQISFVNGQPVLTGMTLTAPNSLLGVGAVVTVAGVSGTATIASVNGASVTFASPLQLVRASQNSPDPVRTVTFANGTNIGAGFTQGGGDTGLLGRELRVGMPVYGAGIQPGTTIAAVSYDSNNFVNLVTFSLPTTAAVTSFNVVSVTDFTASRILVTGANKVQAIGQQPGFLVGMEVTGGGIPAGTRITAIANDGTLTLSNNVTGPVTGISAVTLGAAVGSNVISLGGARSDLAVGMAVTGQGIPDGTVVTGINGNLVTLSNPVTSAAASAISSNSFAVSFGKVISSTASTLTLASVDGLSVGAILSGTGVPTNARITGIDPVTKVVTYVIDNAAASLAVGGSMNGLVSTGTVGTNGNNGFNGSMYNAVLHDGEGAAGTNGYAAGDGNGAVGGTGGRGGNGSSGLPYNADAILGVTGSTFGAIDDTAGLVADWADMSFARAIVQTGKVVQAWIDVGIAIADLAAWNIDLRAGTVALGGDGGAGGSGGNGSDFFGGGTGGAGGNGGQGALSYTDGGAGGDGGTGGSGGFGAGGGSGGAAGARGTTGAAALGGAGDGGEGGFGAGVGTSGDGTGGGGGSGYGGAIFVRSGGTLTITGNSLFENNTVYGGSSNNGGEAGEAVGTDLFMMRGSNVTLAPGAGNTIRFEGSIADDSAASIGGAAWASGNGANIQITGGGLVQFAGENSYTGQTRIGGATLEADLGAGIHADSRLVFNGVSTIGQSLSNATAGVLLTSGVINNRVGSLPGQVSWTGSGGFAAGDDGLVLNFGKISAAAGQSLTWNSGGFMTAGSTLLFGSGFGTGSVTLVNNVNLNSLTGRIAVYDNASVDTDYAVIAGKFSNGGLEINDNGYGGQLYFTNQNSLNALTVRNGLVSTSYDGSIGRLMNASTGGSLTVLGGSVQLHDNERLLAVDIRQQGSVRAYADLVTGQISNSGFFAVDGVAATANISNSGLMTFGGQATTGSINNSGTLGFVGGGVTGAVVNTSTGQLAVTGDITTGDISNAGTAAFAAALTSGNIVNTGTAQMFGAVDAGNVTNSGNILFGSTSDVGTVLNNAGGMMFIKGDMTASGAFENTVDGVVYLAGNVNTASTFTNDGRLVVVGNVTDGVELAAIRRILTTGFKDPTGVVELGGLNGLTLNTLVVEQSGNSLYSGTIVGPGSFVKAGAGTLTLTGANTFTGGLTIEAGGIDTTGGGTFADTLDATVASGASFIVGTADEVRSITNRGSLTANADLIVTTFVNSGAASMNADFGVRGNATNASTGTLSFAADTDTIIAGNVTNAGTINSGSALLVAGNMSNASGARLNLLAGGTNRFGSLTNSGVISAGAAVTVTGAYVQNAGTFTAGGNLSTGSLSGTGGAINIGSNAMTINQTTNGTYAGSISGTGTVFKNGTATLTLTGAAGSFAPANLAIQQGSVAVNGAGILDSALAVSVSSGANLSLITGNQTIRNLSGSGTLALNGNNLFLAQGGNFAGTVTGSGNVQVSSGTFNLSNTINSTAGTFSVQPNSTMNVASTGVLNAPAVTVVGTLGVQGIVNATTTNVSGLVHLGNNAGTIGGTLASTTTNINGGGTLSGVGNVTGTMNVGGATAGSLRPGNSPGTLNVANLNLGNLSTTVMEIEGANSGSFDRINVSGSLDIQGTSSLVIANSNTFELALGEKVSIFAFQPGSVKGQFGSVSSQFGRSVVYNLATGSVVGLGALTQAQFEATAAITANDKAMMNALRVSSSGGVSQYYGGRFVEHVTAALASGTQGAAPAAFAKASPEIYAGLGDHLKLSTLDNRMDLGAYESGGARAVYVTGSFTTSSARNQNDAGYARFKTTDQRINLGVAAQLDFGLVQMSYGNADGNLSGNYFGGKISGDQFSVGLSSPIAMDGGLRVQSRFTYGDYDLNGTRVTNAGLASLKNLSGDTLVYGGGFEYLKSWDKVSLNANLELLGVRTSVDGFTETNAAALENLTVSAQREHFTMLATSIKVGYKFTPHAQGFLTLSTDHEMGTEDHLVTAKVAVEDVAFTVANPGVSKTRFKVGVGTQVQISDAVTWGTEANVGNASSYGAKTSVRVRF